MKLASSFSVPGSPDKVLTLFLDPAIMQACLPGCEDMAQVDDNTYRGTLLNEVAHVKFKATFAAEVTERDIPSDPTQPAQIRAVLKGEDRRLGSTVKLDALLLVSPGSDTDNSLVSYEIEMAMWGKLGRLGESVIRRRTAEVETQFAEALAAVCAGKPVPVRETRRASRAAARQGAAVAPAAGQVDPIAAATLATGTGAAATSAADLINAPSTSPATATVARTSQDWAVLGLAVAAAFAYGVIAGGRRRGAAA